MEALEHPRSVNERDILLGSLGYARDPKLIARTLALTLTEESLAHNDMARIVKSLVYVLFPHEEAITRGSR